jgi:DNA-binding beta-propeller fold protein YncE
MLRFLGMLAALAAVTGLLAPAPAGAALPHPGKQFFGSTSQGGLVVAWVPRDGRRLALTTLALDMRCQGRDLAVPRKYEELYLPGLALTQGGSFSRSGRITRFDSGPGGIGRFPVVASGELRGHFPTPRRLVGSGRLTLTGEFYLSGGSGEGFASERATCRTGPFRFSAEVPQDTRSRTGALTEVAPPEGCLFSRPRKGCRLVPAFGTPSEITIAPDGRNAYVLSDVSEEIRVLHSLARDPRTGRLRLLEGPSGCLAGSEVSGCSAVRGLGSLLDAVLSRDGRNMYLTGDPTAVATFARDPSTGRLEQLPGEAGCMGRVADGCAEAPAFAGSPTAELSPDGKHLYVSWLEPKLHGPDRGLLWFPRQRATGALSVTATPPCLSSFGRHGCRRAPWRHPVEEFVIPSDGRSLYGMLTKGQIAGMSRSASTGALSPLPETETCHFTGRPRGCGIGGYEEAGLVASPDGRTLYYAFEGGDASVVAVMARDRKTGFLDQLGGQAGCVGNEDAAGCRASRGLDLLSELTVSPDGRNVYVGSFGDGLVSAFARQRDGRLVQLAGSAGCLMGLHGHPIIVDLPYRCKRTLLGGEIDGMAVSPDGRHLYVGSGTYPRVGGVHLFRRREGRR